MPLTAAQSRSIADGRLAIRVGLTAVNVAGAAYGLYTARTPAQMRAWERAGAPAGWCDQVYNTGIFALAMPNAQTCFLLFVPDGGDPTNDGYSVAHLPGGRGRQTTLPDVKALGIGSQATASMPLAGASAQNILEWVVAQI